MIGKLNRFADLMTEGRSIFGKLSITNLSWYETKFNWVSLLFRYHRMYDKILHEVWGNSTFKSQSLG